MYATNQGGQCLNPQRLPACVRVCAGGDQLSPTPGERFVFSYSLLHAARPVSKSATVLQQGLSIFSEGGKGSTNRL